jgi:hypothetical protein
MLIRCRCGDTQRREEVQSESSVHSERISVRPGVISSENTRRAAHDRIERSRIQGLVYGAIKDRIMTGATDEEICDIAGLPGNTVRPRRGELVLAGLVKASGRTRATRSGRQAVVWVAT